MSGGLWGWGGKLWGGNEGAGRLLGYRRVMGGWGGNRGVVGGLWAVIRGKWGCSGGFRGEMVVEWGGYGGK